MAAREPGYGARMNADRDASYVSSLERSLRARNRSPNTIYSYLNCLDQAERFLVAHGSTLLAAGRGDLEAYLADLLTKRKPSTVETHHKALRSSTAGWSRRRNATATRWCTSSRRRFPSSRSRCSATTSSAASWRPAPAEASTSAATPP